MNYTTLCEIAPRLQAKWGSSRETMTQAPRLREAELQRPSLPSGANWEEADGAAKSCDLSHCSRLLSFWMSSKSFFHHGICM